ncbi:hypothetical protein AAC387_Pa03g3024 [Persea americana]
MSVLVFLFQKTMSLWRKKLVLQINLIGVCDGEIENPTITEERGGQRSPAVFFRQKCRKRDRKRKLSIDRSIES